MQIITGRVPVARYPGGRTRTRMRAHTHAQYPPLSAHIATGIQVDGIVHHRGSLSNVFFTHLTEATDSIRGKETKHDATYESRCDFPRLRRWACLETTDGIGMIPNDCCAGILFYIRQLATVARFDVSFFFYLASISFEKERIYGASEFWNVFCNLEIIFWKLDSPLELEFSLVSNRIEYR